MKNLTRILPLALLTLLVLSACSSKPSSEVLPTSVNVKDSVTQDQPAPNNEATADVPTSRYGTDLKCDVLKSDENRKNCEMQMNEIIGSMLESEIVSNFSIGRCTELKGDVAKRCQDRLTETGVKGPVTAEEIAKYNDALRGTPGTDPEKPSMTYDSAKCAALTTAGYKEYCEKNVAERAERSKLDGILQSNDKNGCDQLTTESLKNDCKRFFGIEVVETPAPEVSVAPVAPAPAAQQ